MKLSKIFRKRKLAKLAKEIISSCQNDGGFATTCFDLTRSEMALVRDKLPESWLVCPAFCIEADRIQRDNDGVRFFVIGVDGKSLWSTWQNFYTNCNQHIDRAKANPDANKYREFFLSLREDLEEVNEGIRKSVLEIKGDK